MNTLRIVSVASLIGAVVACSSNPTNPADASTEGGGSDSGIDATKKEAGTLPDSGPDDSGDDAPDPTVDPQCTITTDGGTGGACITLGGNIACNPITNSPCKTDAGEACDFDPNSGGLSCFPPPPANTAAVCATCDDQNGPACAPGGTCSNTTTGLKCAAFCCGDTDCTPGHCDTTTLGTAPLGICVK